MANGVPSDPALSDDYLREIGRVAVEWTKVESNIEALIWAFLFVDYQDSSAWIREEDGRAITTHINLLLRLDILMTLATRGLTDWPEGIESFKKMTNDVRTWYPKRTRWSTENGRRWAGRLFAAHIGREAI